jgi:hypothetical protein
MVHSGEQSKIARGEPVAFGEKAIAVTKVEAFRADVPAFA